ncbi:AbrB/MazE/SpoVT family DNA-binding domain-containing protein [[Brevibacterium] frigoritolerans]|nr:AbrB/MazE/SpoVT family DNA-binding domain-containing protein [Peribacillus frigoritolerans]
MVMAQKELERMTMPNRRPKKVKRISVSSKRQISIPKEFYEKLNIGDEVNLELYGNQLVIKPIHEGFEDFSEEILADLVAEGYVGSDLITEFKIRKGKIGMAVDSLIADTIAKGKPTALDDLFGEDEDDF